MRMICFSPNLRVQSIEGVGPTDRASIPPLAPKVAPNM